MGVQGEILSWVFLSDIRRDTYIHHQKECDLTY